MNPINSNVEFDFIFRETRTGNNLYQELSFQDSEALGDVDEGADITGNIIFHSKNNLMSATCIRKQSIRK